MYEERDRLRMFQLTAARRRLAGNIGFFLLPAPVSTHSRPKAAGGVRRLAVRPDIVSTHSRPKAAGFLVC